MRKLMMALVVCIAAAPALGEEVLSCTDADVNGYIVQDGVPRRAGFNPTSFTVKVVSPELRVIKFSTYPRAINYDCFSPWSQPDTFLCTSTLVKAVESVIFNGNKFERAINWSKYVGGQAIGFAVAYGTCTKP